MQAYASESLYLWLSELANGKTPSWCIERQIYPMYENQPQVTLDAGTVDVLNINYLTLQELTGTVVSSSTLYRVAFDDQGTVNTVGIKWSGASVAVTFQVSDDDATWTTVGTQNTSASAGEWTWTDISAARAHQYFRITSTAPMLTSEVYLGTMPQEIPLGQLNRDTYTAQSNKVFPGRPVSYYYQRQQVNPVLYIWPAPNPAAEHAQLIVWRHRHIMDVGTLAQEVEVPQRWMQAMIDGLAALVARETPAVDMNLMPLLEQRAAMSLQAARDGDNDGSPTFIQPYISVYTR